MIEIALILSILSAVLGWVLYLSERTLRRNRETLIKELCKNYSFVRRDESGRFISYEEEIPEQNDI